MKTPARLVQPVLGGRFDFNQATTHSAFVQTYWTSPFRLAMTAATSVAAFSLAVPRNCS